MLNHFFDYKPEVLALDEKALELCRPYFKQMEDIRDYNQLKMLKAFADTQMSSTDMLGGAQPVPERHPHAGRGPLWSAAGRRYPAGRHGPPV